MTNGLHALIADGVDAEVYPGAVWAVGDANGSTTHGVAGVLDPEDPERRMDRGTLFDVASLTKILAAWSSVGALWEEGRLALDRHLGEYWPEVTAHPLGQVSARDLLTHTAGLPPRAALRQSYGTEPDGVRRGVLHEDLHHPPGERVQYTDRAALILGYLAEHLAGQRIDRLSAEQVWRPLGMRHTRFGPLPVQRRQLCAPTELDPQSGTHLKGVVHDFSARLLGGVCGIAGVFTVLDDLALFLGALLAALSGGRSPANFGPAWIAESLRIQTAGMEPARGLFWHPAPGTPPAEDVWVHYGFTGTGIWICPRRRRWAALLTNKLYYSRDRQPLTEIRDDFCRIAFR